MFKDFNIEIKSIQEDGFISGYGSFFNNKDSYNDIVLPGAFLNTLSTKQPKEIKFLLQHQPTETVGYFTLLKEAEQGLYIEGKLIREIKAGEDGYNQIKSGEIKSFSIGYITRDFEKKDGVRYLKDIDLKEISIVSNPANREAKILSLKSDIENRNIQVDDKDNEIDIKALEEYFKNEEKEIPVELKIDNTVVYNLVNNEFLLNFKAVDSLSNEVKQNNAELIKKFYKAFRSEFDDYTIISQLCEKKELFKSFNLRAFDKYFKKNLNLSSNELDTIYNRIYELKQNTKIKNEQDGEVEKTRLKILDCLDASTLF